MKTKLLAVLLCMIFLISLSGCDSQEFTTAKELVDDVYKYTLNLAELETELSKYEGRTDTTALARCVSLQGQIDACEDLIELSTDKLQEVYGKLTDGERQKLKKYAEAVMQDILLDIWS